MNVFGYETFTTFYNDFSIADRFGLSAIQDTYNRAFSEWKSSYKYLTELVLVLNWKIWEHYDKENEDYSRMYDRLWRAAGEYALDNLQGEELEYYLQTTD